MRLIWKFILIGTLFTLSVVSCESPLSPEDSQEKQRIYKLLTKKSWRMVYQVDPYMGHLSIRIPETSDIIETYSTFGYWELVNKHRSSIPVSKGAWSLAKNESIYRYSPQEDWELTKKYDDGTGSLEYVVNISDTTLVLGTPTFHGLFKVYYESFPK